MRHKDLLPLLQEERTRLESVNTEYGVVEGDPRHTWGHAWFNVFHTISNANEPYTPPRRAYRATGEAYRGGYWGGVSFAYVRSGVDSSYGVCRASEGGRHARLEEGCCPRCGEQVL